MADTRKCFHADVLLSMRVIQHTEPQTRLHEFHRKRIVTQARSATDVIESSIPRRDHDARESDRERRSIPDDVPGSYEQDAERYQYDGRVAGP